MLIENMKMAFSAIRSNKMRSALTMLGIIIGWKKNFRIGVILIQGCGYYPGLYIHWLLGR